MEKRFFIQRFFPGKDKRPYWQEYVLHCDSTWVVLDALEAIRSKQDPSLAYRRVCRHGICGSCAMNINGLNRLACETRLADLPSKIRIKPLPGFPVIRDLVVDLTQVYQNIEAIKPYLITKTPPPAKERLQSPLERKKLDGLYECIFCGACTSACPTFWASKHFLGPTALLQACRFVMDSRDEAKQERKKFLKQHPSLWQCHAILNCVEACPKGLNPFEAIVLLRKSLLKP
ncbi:MAG: succinate dehydrogenase iron-sulfur subunit [Candidatus Desulfofervidaceae bacterium]|nr:succinate dehydrogenase iron-sulfur subunit [Candidatus Desulfofervidaceae bacterium]